MVLASAYAHELPHYGLKVGLTNYAAGIGLPSFKIVFNVVENWLNLLLQNFDCSLLYWTFVGTSSFENA